MERQSLFEHFPELQILVEHLGVVMLCIPTRLPGLVVHKPKAVGVRFLAHNTLLTIAY